MQCDRAFADGLRAGYLGLSELFLRFRFKLPGGVGILLAGSKFNGKRFWERRDSFLDILSCDDKLAALGFRTMRAPDADWPVT